MDEKLPPLAHCLFLFPCVRGRPPPKKYLPIAIIGRKEPTYKSRRSNSPFSPSKSTPSPLLLFQGVTNEATSVPFSSGLRDHRHHHHGFLFLILILRRNLLFLFAGGLGPATTPEQVTS